MVRAAKKGGKKAKSAGSPAAPPKQAKPYLAAPVIMQNLLLIESHFRKTGRPLFTQELDISQVAQALWEAPFAVLAHDTSEPEPVFVYANQAALTLFEADWDELIGTPSSKSAEPVDAIQEDRSAALKAALENGYIDDYEGWRQSFKGTRFKISRATVFNVEAPGGEAVGQAAVLREWEWEDGRKGGEGVDAAGGDGAEGGAPPSAEEVAAAEAAVAEQGAAVRALKEEQGLANDSDEVKAAVALLLEKKETLERLRAAAERAAAAGGGSEEGAGLGAGES